jgi:hypothetical protein
VRQFVRVAVAAAALLGVLALPAPVAAETAEQCQATLNSYRAKAGLAKVSNTSIPALGVAAGKHASYRVNVDPGDSIVLSQLGLPDLGLFGPDATAHLETPSLVKLGFTGVQTDHRLPGQRSDRRPHHVQPLSGAPHPLRRCLRHRPPGPERRLRRHPPGRRLQRHEDPGHRLLPRLVRQPGRHPPGRPLPHHQVDLVPSRTCRNQRNHHAGGALRPPSCWSPWPS